MLKITGIQHASFLIADLNRALDFYHGVLGMKLVSDRPDLGYPGAWLQVQQQQIHLLQLPNPDPREGRPQHGGRDRHVAFGISDLDSLVNKLKAAGIAYTLSRSGRRALFCRDPDGNALEFIEETA
ncbi:MAG: VOC family protein [Gammaproteobacteria bacterium]|nr:VOC family protein [Gammaproteobacteria bacterium]